VGAFPKEGAYNEMVIQPSLTCGECPHPWTLPITKHETSVIMNSNMHRLQGGRKGGFLVVLMGSVFLIKIIIFYIYFLIYD
jgi:hypothetical protein